MKETREIDCYFFLFCLYCYCLMLVKERKVPREDESMEQKAFLINYRSVQKYGFSLGKTVVVAF